MEENFGFDDKQLELLEYLWDRRYSLDVIGINSKLVFDWSKQGLLLDPVKPKKGRRKYSVIEFIWLKLVIKLREFGLSLDALRKLRGFLLESISLTELMDDTLYDDEFVETLSEQQIQEVKKLREWYSSFTETMDEEELQDMKRDLNLPEKQYTNTLLSILIANAAFRKKDIHLFITSEGRCFVSESENGTLMPEDVVLNEPYIKYPLRLLISQFIQMESMVTIDQLDHYEFVSQKELKVLELLRKENIVSLTVKLGSDNEIKLIETEENIEFENAKGKLTDFIVRNNYQEIVYKTQQGKITSLRRRTKHK